MRHTLQQGTSPSCVMLLLLRQLFSKNTYTFTITSLYYITMMSLQTEEDSKPGEGWQLVRMEDGRIYYYHQLTRRTTWDVAETWTN